MDIFIPEIIYEINKYLDRTTSLHFLALNKYFFSHISLFFNNHYIMYNTHMNSNIFTKIIKLKSTHILTQPILDNIKSLKTLHYSINNMLHNSHLKNVYIPHNVIHFTLNCTNDTYVNIENFPDNLRSLELINVNITNPINKFPHKLEYLTIDLEFNEKLIDMFKQCQTLKTLNVLFCKKKLINLPQSLQNLHLPRNYNQPLDNLPKLKKLVIGTDFNQLISGLSDSLEEITFYKTSIFDKNVDNLPKSLKILNLPNFFNQPVDNLPNLQILTLGNSFNQSIDNLPDSIVVLHLGHPLKFVSRNIKCTRFLALFDKKINKLPKSLKFLRLSKNSYKKNLNVIPKHNILHDHDEYLELFILSM